MPIYLFWGEDDFSMAKAIKALETSAIDPNWASFNCEKISPDRSNPLTDALNQAMTPPFGSGKRLVWLVDANVTHQCSESTLAELERTLPLIPESSILLLTTHTKPDRRLKSTKLLEKFAQFQEFSPIAPWETKLLTQQVQKFASQIGVKLNSEAVEVLAEALGNDSRSLFSELEKLRLYTDSDSHIIKGEDVSRLVSGSAQNSLDLAKAMRAGNTALALGLVAELDRIGEPPLKIVATLIGQFRTWLWVRLMMAQGERDDKAIAQAAEITNPKRIYFLRQEVQSLSVEQLAATLPLFLELEFRLKQGANPLATMQSYTVQVCQICQK
ncbi:DNA polymerase III subunit delta [Merismopedia glauca]|uniref:DNA polymerase III subunit delta n=1 Tax=Merismopedia glauca CCAP 1448/3 TaxID=1296344 RepID=A0A2T1C0I1_9CYAN|nr:DNA polymerase III subunit delta [Merismopedia glauca]PSB01771.1 DNA polymerase III subunit delta [Merismopedia glauca CCAP 1448/3]